MSLVSQDVVLFDDTIKNNIAYANSSASQSDVEEACKFAAADDFIENFLMDTKRLLEKME